MINMFPQALVIESISHIYMLADENGDLLSWVETYRDEIAHLVFYSPEDQVRAYPWIKVEDVPGHLLEMAKKGHESLIAQYDTFGDNIVDVWG
jgi:hypothetical protein